MKCSGPDDTPPAITTRLVDTTTTPMLLKLLAAHKLPAEKLITHGRFNLSSNISACGLRYANAKLIEFKFKDIPHAYSTFRAAAENKALKVILEM